MLEVLCLWVGAAPWAAATIPSEQVVCIWRTAVHTFLVFADSKYEQPEVKTELINCLGSALHPLRQLVWGARRVLIQKADRRHLLKAWLLEILMWLKLCFLVLPFGYGWVCLLGQEHFPSQSSISSVSFRILWEGGKYKFGGSRVFLTLQQWRMWVSSTLISEIYVESQYKQGVGKLQTIPAFNKLNVFSYSWEINTFLRTAIADSMRNISSKRYLMLFRELVNVPVNVQFFLKMHLFLFYVFECFACMCVCAPYVLDS